MKKAKQDQEMIGMAPVAEYRGVAIVEIAGNKKAVWKGTEYGTDGRSWFVLRDGMAARFYERFPTVHPTPNQAERTPGTLELIALPDERQAKMFLDGIAEEGENPAAFFHSCREILALMGEPPQRPLTRWDEDQGLFVE